MSTVEMIDVREAGGEALLVTVADLPAAMSLAAHLRAQPLGGQRDLTPAAQTVLIHARGGTDLRKLAAELGERAVPLLDSAPGKVVTVDVVYDGEDLARVAELTSLSTQEIIALHTGADWTVGFAGFAPGFFYLVSTSGFPKLPRRESPRTAVPAGSVAVAGEFSAVYPRESPGGWQLIGHTDADMFDLSRDPVTLVEPGDVVKFQAVRDSLRLEPQTPSSAEAEPKASIGASLTVIAPGTFASVQDSGRSGHSVIGVGAAGFADRAAARRANRLVGNHQGTACIELIGGGFVVQAESDVILAVTGARNSMIVFDEESDLREPESGKPFPLYAGEALEIDFPEAGLRNYLAVRGGFEAGAVLGSQSTDTLSGIGPSSAPKRLGTGDELVIGRDAPHSVGNFEPDTLPDAEASIRIHWGPRDDWFTPAAKQLLLDTPWTVSAQSNRVGLRLEGAALDRDPEHTGELMSEGVALGSIQVPANGEPILFHVDHPVTGGYPVIAVVERQDIDKAAQLPPGSTVRFRANLPK